MPRRSHSPARRRPVPQYRDAATGERVFEGSRERDAVSGFFHPRNRMVRQRGRLVSGDWHDNTLDVVDPIDRRSFPPPRLPLPVPYYRVVSGLSMVLTTSTTERDNLVEQGYTWRVEGYVHRAVNTETEDGLAPLYRLFQNTVNADHVWTTSASERDTLMVAGWVLEGNPVNVWTTAAPRRKPIYRARRLTGTFHFFTEKFVEVGLLGPTWEFEGVGFYVASSEERTS